ncbi:YkgJ family cysteine cluster protein [Pseudodesulfovibrio pelocollis]|uniref:YkgJ family cysteine cluster protein n=1 Tax=Pseudodesulfovibrio pelocollis TaxID=3051432 RepID=UPI00255AEEB9|nr:YkgJ family cysteine cluster protein [Pseudodesulfovibrio sp. SB368]
MTRIRSDASDTCRRCSLQGPTCCRMTAGQEEFCFPVSQMEKDRVRDHAPFTGGFVLAQNSAAFIDNVRRLFPGEDDLIQALFPPTGEHYRLTVDTMGACRFLGPEGCEIPHEARPYYCRLYPFWVVGRDVTFFDSATCLARREERTLPRMLKCFDTNKASVTDLYGRLRLAWGLPPARGARKVKKGF